LAWLNLAPTQSTRSFRRRKTETWSVHFVAKSAEIQADYSECDDVGRKREIIMECHTSMRTFDEGAFFDGDEEGWKAYVNGGLAVVHRTVSLFAY
jgi:hypothetical protein